MLRLKEAVFSQNPPCDAHILAYLVQESGIDMIEGRIYCIMRAGDSMSLTGIWIGYSWCVLLSDPVQPVY